MQTLLDPAVLFFVFGVFAGSLKSNLEIPPAIAKFLSLYLLMALGLKGGFALAQSGLDAAIVASLGAAMLLALLIPYFGYVFLRRFVNPFDAVAVAASYGSVSAATFVTAIQHVQSLGMDFGGHMTVAMVLMESPAIIMAVGLAHKLRHSRGTPIADGERPSAPLRSAGAEMRGILHEAFTDGAQLLLLGSLFIGWLSGDAGKVTMQPFSGDLFKGMLAFFLLDMGLMVARNFGTARRQSRVLVVYAGLAPFAHAAAALVLAGILRLAPADAALLMVLAASASYIVVPAVLRSAVPEANPSVYLGLSLGITFPLNILVGIPLYTATATRVLG